MKNINLRLWIAALLMIALAHALPVQAAPTVTSPTFAEVGNDVTATWRITDLASQSQNNLPLTLEVFLCEDDILFDDRLGMTTVVVPPVGTGGTTPTGSGGYRSPVFTVTFPSASNQATGFGDDYYLTLDGSDCPNRRGQDDEYDQSRS